MPTSLERLTTQLAHAQAINAQYPDPLLVSAIRMMATSLPAYVDPESPPLVGNALIGYQYVEDRKRALGALTGDPRWLDNVDESY